MSRSFFPITVSSHVSCAQVYQLTSYNSESTKVSFARMDDPVLYNVDIRMCLCSDKGQP